MRILFIGDIHGDLAWIDVIEDQIRAEQPDKIVQCGDFGYWEHVDEGRHFLGRLEKRLTRQNKTLYWVDGNHENHARLRRQYRDLDGERFVIIRPHIRYIPRAHTWSWAGQRFLGLGGAYSIDRAGRILGESWWLEETITGDEADDAAAVGKVDIMVTHDCPAGVDLFGSHHEWDDLFPEAVHNRALLKEVVKATRPALLIHGHYHLSHRSHLDIPYEQDGHLAWHRTQIIGLNCNRASGSFAMVQIG